MPLKFTIIVPVYEQWNLVPRLLAALEGQSIARDSYDVLLVNNQPGFAGPYPALPSNAKILQCETPGSYAARNVGVAAATGEWLVFTDADCVPAPSWLEQIERAIAQSGPDTLIAGAIRVVPGRPRPIEVFDAVKGIPQARYVSRGYAATANLSVRAEVVRSLGGFDQRRLSGGDSDFCRRAVAKGHALRYVPEAVVDHPARSTWAEVSNKSRRLKGGQLLFGSKSNRAIWVMRTLLPPWRMIRTLLAAREHALSLRIGAVGVALALWGVEIVELMRLTLGAAAERR